MAIHQNPNNKLVLLSADEQRRRLDRVRQLMSDSNIDAILISDNANTYYITGRVFAGYVYIPIQGEVVYFIKRPVELSGDNIVYIRKPENITETIGLNAPATIGLEMDVTSYSAIQRLSKIFPGSEAVNSSSVMNRARAVKTEVEVDMIRRSGIAHERVYSRIPHLFREGMSDIELQVEIERVARLEGCLGQFRISGDTMELFMGNLLVGPNADNPSPYDFAMGGAGINPSLPVGANGEEIKPGETIMVDMNGDFTGYMTDMTRTFALGDIESLALKAHQCSIDIHDTLKTMARPGVEAKSLYETAYKMAKDAGLERFFMGHRQHAGFIGHGVGIEINELPVIAPRSKDILQKGNVIAIEPKFVIPNVGAVGIENTYHVTDDGLECLTNSPEQIIYFDV